MQQVSKQVNILQKQISAVKKAQAIKAKAGPAPASTSDAAVPAEESVDDLVAQKFKLEESIKDLRAVELEDEAALRKQANKIGNIVHDSVAVSDNEVRWRTCADAISDAKEAVLQDNNEKVKVWHPDGDNVTPSKPANIPEGASFHSHHELMYRLGILDQERGSKVAGHRGYFLMGYGVDLNQALISYGLEYLRTKGYTKIQTPFMMKRALMAKTAQLEEFDEALYKLDGNPAATIPSELQTAADKAAATSAEEAAEDEKYLIATSEQPLSGLHSDEWFDDPLNQLPVR